MRVKSSHTRKCDCNLQPPAAGNQKREQGQHRHPLGEPQRGLGRAESTSPQRARTMQELAVWRHDDVTLITIFLVGALHAGSRALIGTGNQWRATIIAARLKAEG
ncbi:hypothetical protein BaRGS_00002456 [Batillaria attramentaria]|uniref:Uncharacterized protein n=1 Tax=Batillaria attramentaria TaxID=370345 RepID=A0ABD0M355_9CAEN